VTDIKALEAEKAQLVAVSKASGLEMTEELAFAWWRAATALRDAREAVRKGMGN
jgi:hypothetical protein